ncbi:VOC family protein [Micromonospora sp. NPDC049559]|uniref:VOC family protein n=1 Tax=Micromonospora sp. NPDC049559 TaxID=3155923 RepID=UPI003416D62A
MGSLYPRLLVRRFDAAFRFYRGILPALLGAELARGEESGPYASWDLDGRTLLALFDRDAMGAALGVTGPAGGGTGAAGPGDAAGRGAGDAGTGGTAGGAGESDDVPGRAVLVIEVEDVSAALELVLDHGGRTVVPVRARPAWGPTARTAHAADPEGNLLELQSY